MSEPSIAASREGAEQRCTAAECGARFGINERIYVCAHCGGPLEIRGAWGCGGSPAELREKWKQRAATSDAKDRSGVWRYREMLPFGPDVGAVTLFEGNTPLYDAPRSAEYAGVAHMQLKHQGCNPTGSFKDTGMTAAVTQAVLLGARTVVCASTGNTAASLAAYAARAAVRCAILVPRGQITAAKLAQSMDYGAAVLEIDGNFDEAMRVVQELSADPEVYLANSINPFRIEGQKTVAFELLQQRGWEAPEHVLVPGGNLGNSSALAKGFAEMRSLGLIRRLPKLHVIQAEGAAPLAHAFATLDPGRVRQDSSLFPREIKQVKNPQTLATAIKIGAPVSWEKSLRGVLESCGGVLAVSEWEIADAKAVIGRDGVGCEPASATTLAGLRRLVAAGVVKRGESVVAVLTGHVLKDPEYASKYHGGVLVLPEGPGESRPATIAGKFRNPPERVAASRDAIMECLRRRQKCESPTGAL